MGGIFHRGNGDCIWKCFSKNVVCQTIENGRDLRTIIVTSNQHFWDEKQKEVRNAVDSLVNGGQYNVVSVKTCYSDEYLTSAEIQYNVANDCNNKNLRVEFIYSDEHFWDLKQKEIKPRLEQIVNSGQYDIQETNTIMLKGYLVAAEVYYREK